MPISFRPQVLIALAGLAALLVTLSASSGAFSSAPDTQSADTYVEAMVGAPRFINPLLAASDSDRDITHLVFSGLTSVDARGEIVPDLASRWEVSPDGLVYTFTLKPNLRWHDSEPVTAEDVRYTIEALLKSPDFPGDPMLAAPWKDVRVGAPGQGVVTLTLAAPNSAFLQYTTLGVLPRHLWATVKAADMARSDLNLYPVGAGPWRAVVGRPLTRDGSDLEGELPGTPVAGSAQPGEGIILEPNPYMPPVQRKVSRIWFRLYPNFGAALTGFRVGEAHGLGHIPADRLAEVAAIPGATIHKQTLARYTMLLINTRQPLLEKPDVRQALEFAIDRRALASNEIIGGEALHSPVLARSWAYDPSVAPRPYDPAQARRLLDSAGWVTSASGGMRARDGVTMTLVLAANRDIPANVEAARLLEGYLKQVGVDVKLALVSRESLLKDYLGPRSFHIALASWEAQGADPDVYQYWHSSQAFIEGGLNFSGWANTQADEALQAARLTTDREARKARYSAFQKAFQTDVPAIILYSPLYTYATHAPAQGVALPSIDLLDPADRFDTLRDWALGMRTLP